MSVDGLPKVRPVCKSCGRKLRYFATEAIGGKQFQQWCGYGWLTGELAPLFCTLRCATSFAVASYRGGYRGPA